MCKLVYKHDRTTAWVRKPNCSYFTTIVHLQKIFMGSKWSFCLTNSSNWCFAVTSNIWKETINKKKGRASTCKHLWCGEGCWSPLWHHKRPVFETHFLKVGGTRWKVRRAQTTLCYLYTIKQVKSILRNEPSKNNSGTAVGWGRLTDLAIRLESRHVSFDS